MAVHLNKYEKMYYAFDEAHDIMHMFRVRKRAMELARIHAPEFLKLVWISATLHDIGLCHGRNEHEQHGVEIFRKDEYFNEVLTKAERLIVEEAIREHRASTGKPKHVVAKVVSDADRSADTTIEKVERSIRFAMSQSPGKTIEEYADIALHQLRNKYKEGGYGRRCYFPETSIMLENDMLPILKVKEACNFLALLPDDHPLVAYSTIRG